MCITSKPAELSKTLLYAGEAMKDGELVHVLGYQNRSKNLHDGPNCMILPIPSREAMTSENVIDTSKCPDILSNYAESIKTRTRRMRRSLSLSEDNDSIEIFDTGSYTVLLSKNASLIFESLDQVSEERRPEVSRELIESMGSLYPGWSFALCCFSSKEVVEAEPLLWWYKPLNKNQLFAPALDSHDGSSPVKGEVEVDHTVMYGSTIEPTGAEVTNYLKIPRHVRNFMPPKVKGKQFADTSRYQNRPVMLDNGDFVVNKLTFSSPVIKRVAPSGLQ